MLRLFLAELQRSDRVATYVIRHKNKNSSHYDRLSRTCLLQVHMAYKHLFHPSKISFTDQPSYPSMPW